jgi:hypothetical protein
MNECSFDATTPKNGGLFSPRFSSQRCVKLIDFAMLCRVLAIVFLTHVSQGLSNDTNEEPCATEDLRISFGSCNNVSSKQTQKIWEIFSDFSHFTLLMAIAGRGASATVGHNSVAPA